MTTPKPILCVGALTGDLMMQVPELPRAAGKYMARRAVLVAAGMAASAATAIARLGHPVALWASAGTDLIGDFIVGEMAGEGIDIGWIRRLPDTMSATATILVDHSGERVVVPYYADALLAAPQEMPDFAAFSAVLVDVRWPKAAALALDGARLAGIPAILDLDVGPRHDLADLAARASHIVASLDGARALTSAGSVDDAIEALAELTGACVVVTAGEAGASWRESGQTSIRRQPAFAVTAVDTNAAGDVFHGAFAAGVATGMPLAETVRLASAAAALKCMRYGGRTGAPTRMEVEAFLASRLENA